MLIARGLNLKSMREGSHLDEKVSVGRILEENAKHYTELEHF